MKEIVVISGKGGTGKTSLVASFATITDARGNVITMIYGNRSGPYWS